MSLSGSIALAVRSIVRLALAVQVVELVPSGHGSVIDALDVATVTVGAWFGGGGSVRALRCPIQNCAMNPFGSSENLNPFGKPLVVAGTVVPGMTTKVPFTPGTHAAPPGTVKTQTFVMFCTVVLELAGLK